MDVVCCIERYCLIVLTWCNWNHAYLHIQLDETCTSIFNCGSNISPIFRTLFDFSTTLSPIWMLLTVSLERFWCDPRKITSVFSSCNLRKFAAIQKRISATQSLNLVSEEHIYTSIVFCTFPAVVCQCSLSLMGFSARCVEYIYICIVDISRQPSINVVSS